jgi:hypothetical protein
MEASLGTDLLAILNCGQESSSFLLLEIGKKSSLTVCETIRFKSEFVGQAGDKREPFEERFFDMFRQREF